MPAKPALAFQPAPRPQPRTTPEDTERLLAATQDLGFGRATATPVASSPAVAPPEPSSGDVLGKPFSAAPATAHAIVPPGQVSPSAEPRRAAPALKFDVPEGVWDQLRMEALKRRVTVKYLVLEALADRGYAVDLAAVPEDGRRLR